MHPTPFSKVRNACRTVVGPGVRARSSVSGSASASGKTLRLMLRQAAAFLGVAVFAASFLAASPSFEQGEEAVKALHEANMKVYRPGLTLGTSARAKWRRSSRRRASI